MQSLRALCSETYVLMTSEQLLWKQSLTHLGDLITAGCVPLHCLLYAVRDLRFGGEYYGQGPEGSPESWAVSNSPPARSVRTLLVAIESN